MQDILLKRLEVIGIQETLNRFGFYFGVYIVVVPVCILVACVIAYLIYDILCLLFGGTAERRNQARSKRILVKRLRAYERAKEDFVLHSKVYRMMLALGPEAREALGSEGCREIEENLHRSSAKLDDAFESLFLQELPCRQRTHPIRQTLQDSCLFFRRTDNKRCR